MCLLKTYYIWDMTFMKLANQSMLNAIIQASDIPRHASPLIVRHSNNQNGGDSLTPLSTICNMSESQVVGVHDFSRYNCPIPPILLPVRQGDILHNSQTIQTVIEQIEQIPPATKLRRVVQST